MAGGFCRFLLAAGDRESSPLFLYTGSQMSKRKRMSLWGVVWCGALLALAACHPRGEAGAFAEQLTLAGSTSVEPFAEMLAEHYMVEYPDTVTINVQGGGSTAGVRAALSGAADIGMSSRNLKPEEVEQGLGTQLIARDAIAVIVHPRNPVTDLTLAQVRGIFAGHITNWAQVGGENRSIVVVTREEGSGTRGAFEDLVMEGNPILLKALRQDSNGAVRVIVGGDRYAIGYISLGLVDERVRAVRLDGMVASVENARSGAYGLSRPFLFLWKGELTPSAEAFVAYVLSAEGQRLLAQEGLVTEGE